MPVKVHLPQRPQADSAGRQDRNKNGNLQTRITALTAGFIPVPGRLPAADSAI